MMFLAEMVWSCYPTHVVCCAFKVKGIQGDQSQPLVAAHPKLSRGTDRNSSKMREDFTFMCCKRVGQWDQGFGNSDFQPPKDGPKTWPSRSFSTGGRHPSPGNARWSSGELDPSSKLGSYQVLLSAIGMGRVLGWFQYLMWRFVLWDRSKRVG